MEITAHASFNNHPTGNRTRQIRVQRRDHDLFIWLDNTHTPAAFQYSYSKLQDDEHCISRDQRHGYRHNRVDAGERTDGGYRMTPVLLPDGQWDAQSLADAFRRLSGHMPGERPDFVYHALAGFPGD